MLVNYTRAIIGLAFSSNCRYLVESELGDVKTKKEAEVAWDPYLEKVNTRGMIRGTGLRNGDHPDPSAGEGASSP